MVRKTANLHLKTYNVSSLNDLSVISEQLMSEMMLPGLRCLLRDMEVLAPERAPVISSMIREFEDKVDAAKPMDK